MPKEECNDQLLTRHYHVSISLIQTFRLQIISTLSKGTILNGKNLYEINSIGNILYLVLEGKLGKFRPGKVQVGEYLSEDLIGEMALLHQFLREETVIAQEDSAVLILKRNDFKNIIENYSIMTLDEKKTFLLNVELFSILLVNTLDGLEKDMQETMCKEMVPQSFSAQSTIFNENSQSNCVYIIKSGEVGVYINDIQVRVLESHQSFGLIGVILRLNRTSTVKAITDCDLFSIGIEAFEKMFKKDFTQSLLQLYIIYVFRKSKYLNLVPKESLMEIASSFEVKFCLMNEPVYQDGEDVLNKIVIIIEGGIINVRINHY